MTSFPQAGRRAIWPLLFRAFFENEIFPSFCPGIKQYAPFAERLKDVFLVTCMLERASFLVKCRISLSR